jgi:NADP-dependent aldehyde dehydrogenase
LKKGPETLAQGLFGSFTLGAGQFCTKPGIVLVPEAPEGQAFLDELRSLVAKSEPFTMLTSGIAREYERATAARNEQLEHSKDTATKTSSDQSQPGFHVDARLFHISAEDFLFNPNLVANPRLTDEIFGPNTLLVTGCDTADLICAANSLEGHLTVTILGDEKDLADNRELIQILERKAGRLIFNGFPTGVEVTHAMVHGGPYPSTSDPRFTSVGSLAIYRFVRPVCFQNFPQAMLPPELQDANPLGITRLRDGKLEPAEHAEKFVSHGLV